LVFATVGNPAFDGMSPRFVLGFLSFAAPKAGSHRESPADRGMLRLSWTFEGVRFTALHFRLESRPSFHYINEIHEQASSCQKALGQDTNGKKANPRQEDSP
jgi:hypothetical protein